MFTFCTENKALKLFKSLIKNSIVETYWWRIGYSHPRVFGNEKRSCNCKSKYCKGHPVLTIKYKNLQTHCLNTVSFKYNSLTGKFTF